MPFNVHLLLRFLESGPTHPFSMVGCSKATAFFIWLFKTIAKHWCFSLFLWPTRLSSSNTFLARQEINVRMQKAIAKLMGLAPTAQWIRLCLYQIAVMESRLNVLAIQRSQEVALLPLQNETSSCKVFYDFLTFHIPTACIRSICVWSGDLKACLPAREGWLLCQGCFHKRAPMSRCVATRNDNFS